MAGRAAGGAHTPNDCGCEGTGGELGGGETAQPLLAGSARRRQQAAWHLLHGAAQWLHTQHPPAPLFLTLPYGGCGKGAQGRPGRPGRLAGQPGRACPRCRPYWPWSGVRQQSGTSAGGAAARWRWGGRPGALAAHGRLSGPAKAVLCSLEAKLAANRRSAHLWALWAIWGLVEAGRRGGGAAGAEAEAEWRRRGRAVAQIRSAVAARAAQRCSSVLALYSSALPDQCAVLPPPQALMECEGAGSMARREGHCLPAGAGGWLPPAGDCEAHSLSLPLRSLSCTFGIAFC